MHRINVHQKEKYRFKPNGERLEVNTRLRVEIDKDTSICPVSDKYTKQLIGVSVRGLNKRHEYDHLFLTVECIPSLIKCIKKAPEQADLAFKGVDLDLVTKVSLIPPNKRVMPRFIKALQTMIRN